MYPCSFIAYLKQLYNVPANHLVFAHTIKVRNFTYCLNYKFN